MSAFTPKLVDNERYSRDRIFLKVVFLKEVQSIVSEENDFEYR